MDKTPLSDLKQENIFEHVRVRLGVTTSALARILGLSRQRTARLCSSESDYPKQLAKLQAVSGMTHKEFLDRCGK